MRARRKAIQEVEELRQELATARGRIAELERQLTASHGRDPVTGLPRPKSFARRVEHEIERSRRYGHKLSVAVMDIDGFRTINASRGLGDELLAAVGKALSDETRTTDFVARTGGEFLIGLPDTDAAEAVRAFERVLLALEELRVGPVECVSASVGVAEWSRGLTLDDLLETAAARMRAAKAAGGGRAEARGDAADRGAEWTGHEEAVVGLAEALSERDRYTGAHSGEVLHLVEKVARGLALDEREIQRIRYAALLHDIGKVAIPDDILKNPKKLDEHEFEVMKTHTIVGERILRAIPGLGPVARIVRHEHERFDGTGYPDGLRGEQIPMGSRIILACDAYQAMTTDRPYRKAMEHAEAVRELGKYAGTQFDPQVTEVLIGTLYGQRQTGGDGGPAAVGGSDPVAA
ncbi:MAG: HD domain-containing phosphohydrolase [Thermoleophilaceae bacterium]